MFACAAVAVVCARVSRGVIELVGLRSLQLVSGETVQSSLVIMTIETVHYNTTRHCSGSLIADSLDEAGSPAPRSGCPRGGANSDLRSRA